MPRRTPRLLIVISAAIGITLTTVFAIKLAKGYRPSFKKGSLQGTGLLAANSFPRGATVFINDKLTTATDDTLNLPPGEYHLKIAKDGYISWEKTLQLEAELVTQTNARLFPAVPDLKPLTFSGTLNPTPSPDGQKIAFAVNNATTEAKNGLYILELSSTLFLKSAPRQIVRNTGKYDFSHSQLTWSPDSSELLATFNLAETNEANLLLRTNTFNDLEDLKDVTAQLPVTLNQWNEFLDRNQQDLFKELPDFIQYIATASAQAVYFSPDEEKMLYTATDSAQIPEELIPSLPASSTQPETRQLEPGGIYIYDLKEDKNFQLGQTEVKPVSSLTALEQLTTRYYPLSLQNTQWYPDSSHVIIVNDDKITIAEYDNTNHQTVYAGPFSTNFAFPWPNGSRLLILASLNGGTNQPPNLYSINLK